MSAMLHPGRGLLPFVIAPERRAAARGGVDWVFWLALAAIVSQLTISSNLLRVMAIPYNAPGGLPFWKLHVGTYLTFMALAVQVRRPDHALRSLVGRVAAEPHFPAAAALMVFCSVSCTLAAGVSGSAVYIESYLSAAILGFVLIDLTVAQRQRIGRLILALLVLNVAMCLVETILKARLIPIILTDASQGAGQAADVQLIESQGEFRGTALFDHPLTGAMMTMMGAFLCLAGDLRPRLKAAVLLLMLVGLIAFGGRTALAMTYLILAIMAALDFVRRLMTRRLDARYLALAVFAAMLIPALLAGLLLGTSLGERIAGKLTGDDESAQARVVQWFVLGEMSASEHAFGLGPTRMVQIIERLGLTFPFADIENFWLLSYINLGIVGFIPWLAGFFTMLRGLARLPSTPTRLLLLAVVLVASTSNSLGRKSNILFVATAVIICGAAFRETPALSLSLAKPAQRGGLRPFRLADSS